MTEAAGHLRFQTAYHMDGESLLEGHMLLQGRYHELVSTITVDEAYTFARQLLGTSLNSIQVRLWSESVQNVTTVGCPYRHVCYKHFTL